MDRKHFSHGKHTTKAGSQNLSTTSSITGTSSSDTEPKPDQQDAPGEQIIVPTRSRNDPPQLLSHDQQDLFLEMLSRGASPAMACRNLGLLLSDANHTRRLDGQFAHRWQEIEQALSQNVAAALYSSAIKGTATAQTFYLKQQPPPGWGETAGRRPLQGDNFEECTDAELVEFARTNGIDPPPEIEAGNESPGDEEVPGSVSQDPADRE